MQLLSIMTNLINTASVNMLDIIISSLSAKLYNYLLFIIIADISITIHRSQSYHLI